MTDELLDPDDQTQDAPAADDAAPPPDDATPPAVDAATEDDAEPQADDQGRIPVSVVKELRAKLRETKAQADQSKQQLEMAARAIQQFGPQIQFLYDHPELMQQGVEATRQTPRAEAAQHADEASAEDVDLARTLDLYTADGKPDGLRARRITAFIDKRAQQLAEKAVSPIQTRTRTERAAYNYQRALQVKDREGRQPSPQALQYFWQQLGPDYTSDDQVAHAAALLAIGYDQVYGQGQPQPPATMPVATEASGDRAGRRVTLTDLDRRIAADRKVKPEKWQDYLRGHEPGRPFVLEDDD